MSEGGARRPSVVRLKLKFSAFGNAVSLFPKEKYPAACSEAAGERRDRDRTERQGEFAAPFHTSGAAFGHHPHTFANCR